MNIEIELKSDDLPKDIMTDYLTVTDKDGNETTIEWYETNFTSEEGYFNAYAKNAYIYDENDKNNEDNELLKEIISNAKEFYLGISYIGDEEKEIPDLSHIDVKISVLDKTYDSNIYIEAVDGWEVEYERD